MPPPKKPAARRPKPPPPPPRLSLSRSCKKELDSSPQTPIDLTSPAAPPPSKPPNRIECNLKEESVQLTFTLPIRHVLTFPFLSMHGVVKEVLKHSIAKSEEAAREKKKKKKKKKKKEKQLDDGRQHGSPSDAYAHDVVMKDAPPLKRRLSFGGRVSTTAPRTPSSLMDVCPEDTATHSRMSSGRKSVHWEPDRYLPNRPRRGESQSFHPDDASSFEKSKSEAKVEVKVEDRNKTAQSRTPARPPVSPLTPLVSPITNTGKSSAEVKVEGKNKPAHPRTPARPSVSPLTPLVSSSTRSDPHTEIITPRTPRGPRNQISPLLTPARRFLNGLNATPTPRGPRDHYAGSHRRSTNRRANGNPYGKSAE